MGQSITVAGTVTGDTYAFASTIFVSGTIKQNINLPDGMNTLR